MLDKVNEICTKKDELFKARKEYVSKIESIDREISQNERDSKKYIKLIPKAHSNEITQAGKRTIKKRENSESGINKVLPVPEVLIKYLGLKKDAELSRPKVASALNDKYKEQNLKMGQLTFLDQATIEELEVSDETINKLNLTPTKANTWFCDNKVMEELKISENDVDLIKSKNDQTIGCTFDAKTIKKLKLSDDVVKQKFRKLVDGYIIKFNQPQSFLATFY